MIGSSYLGTTQPHVTGRRALGGGAPVSGSVDLAVSCDELTVELRAGFGGNAAATVGLEEELIVVDAGSLEPVDDVDSVLGSTLDRRITHEFRASQLELVIPPAQTAGRLSRILGNARLGLIGALHGRARILAAGGHPTAKAPIRVTTFRATARSRVDHPWATRRGLPDGSACPCRRRWARRGPRDLQRLPQLPPGARSARGELAVLRGHRLGPRLEPAQVDRGFPAVGSPAALRKLGGLRLVPLLGDSRRALPESHPLLVGPPADDPSTARSSSASPTRQTSLDETAAVVAVCQSLVAALSARYAAGEELYAHATHMVNENRWRALRGGLDGYLVDYSSGIAQPARERLTRLLLDLEPHAGAIGCADELAHAWPMIAQNGAARQRAIAAKHGLGALVESLVGQTEALPAARETRPRPARQGSAGDVAEIGRVP